MKKWVLIIIIILIVFFVLGVLLIRWGLKSMGPWEEKVKVGEESYVQLDLSKPFPEKASYSFSQFTFKKGHNFLGLLAGIKRMKEDEKIKGIILTPGSIAISGAKTDELINSLKDFKESGKEIIAFLEYGSLRSIYFTTVCDKIYCVPTGIFVTPGMSIETMFLKNTMDKIGVEWNVIQMGKYKGAMEIFTHDTLTTATKEVYNSILDEFYSEYMKNVTESGKFSEDQIMTALDKGIMTAAEAKELGFIDSLMYYNDFKKMLDLDEDENYLTARKYLNSKKVTIHNDNKVALIYALGSIHTGKSEPTPFGGSETIGSATLSNAIIDAAEDDDIKAIVIRVNSPGGSALASDIIWDAMRDAKEKKPVIISMAEVAGSGGYYISMAADTILADPSTITGSIGVIFSKPNLHNLYNKLGVTKDALYRGDKARMFSDYKNLTDEEREVLTSYIQSIYDDFVGKAAKDREMTFEELHEVAQGRIWTGLQAVKIGIIDRTGGFLEAIDVAKKMIGVPLDDDVELITFPKKKGNFVFDLNLGLGKMLLGQKVSEEHQEIMELMNARQLFEDDEPLFLMPGILEIK
ncbi:signal peptide peptidase SppA [bacterium]|nr:signal peptide peptidase SppA [bacterium]